MKHFSEPIKISIVDDHKLFRQGVVQILQRFTHFNVLKEVESCSQLLDTMADQIPDIILLDLEMPDIDGMEACKLILKRFPDQKIIALSMHFADSFIFHMMKSGARSYLPKDIDQESLRQAIEEVFSQGHYFTEAITKAMLKGMRTNSRQKPQFSNPLNPLSKRETEILSLICKGLTTNEIASQLFISMRTVECHRQNLLEKTGTNNSVSLAVYAITNGLINVPLTK